MLGVLLLSTGTDDAEPKQNHTGDEESTVHGAILSHRVSRRHSF